MASLPSGEMSQLRALEVMEGVLGLVRYFPDAVIVSSLDEIVLVLFSGYLLSNVMANTGSELNTTCTAA